MFLTSVLSTALLAGCNSTPKYEPPVEPEPAKPLIRTYRGDLETRATWEAPNREYASPHASIEFELGSDPGNRRHFGFKGVVINGENLDYGANLHSQPEELSFVLKPDTNERIIFREAQLNGNGMHPATARSEISELYVFSPVMNADNKPSTEFTYSLTDPIHGKKATFKRPDLTGVARGILHDNNETIIMPDLMPTRINGEWFYTPLAESDPSKSPFYLIPVEGTEVGTQRPTGEIFLRTTRGIYRGTRMTVTDYNNREKIQRLQREEAARQEQLQITSPGVGTVR